MESQLELLKETVNYADKFKQELPAVMTTHHALREEVYKDGALSSKTKHLMALAAAMRAGAVNCSISHTRLAMDAGASKEEVMETISVALVMGGTPVMGMSLRVIKMMEEMGKM